MVKDRASMKGIDYVNSTCKMLQFRIVLFGPCACAFSYNLSLLQDLPRREVKHRIYYLHEDDSDVQYLLMNLAV